MYLLKTVKHIAVYSIMLMSFMTQATTSDQQLFRLLQQTAKGDVDSAFKLAAEYLEPSSKVYSLEKGLSLHQKLASNRYIPSAQFLAHYYALPRSGIINAEKSKFWFDVLIRNQAQYDPYLHAITMIHSDQLDELDLAELLRGNVSEKYWESHNLLNALLYEKGIVYNQSLFEAINIYRDLQKLGIDTNYFLSRSTLSLFGPKFGSSLLLNVPFEPLKKRLSAQSIGHFKETSDPYLHYLALEHSASSSLIGIGFGLGDSLNVTEVTQYMSFNATSLLNAKAFFKQKFGNDFYLTEQTMVWDFEGLSIMFVTGKDDLHRLISIKRNREIDDA